MWGSLFRQRVRPLALSLLLLAGCGVHAHPLSEVLRRVAQQNPEVAVREALQRAADAELEGARWARYPAVTGEVRTEFNGTQAITRLEQPLWTGGRLTGQLARAQAQTELSRSDTATLQRDLLIQAAGVYFEVIRLQARIDLATENLNELSRLQEAIERRAAAEVAPQADLVLAMNRVQQANSERLQLARQRDVARLQLEQLSGGLEGTALQTPTSLPWRDQSAPSLVDAARSTAPALRRLDALIEVERQNVALAQAQLLPSVVGGYEYSWGSRIAGTDRGRWFIGLQYQSGTGLAAAAAVQAALARQQSAEEQRAVVSRDLERQILSAHSELQGLAVQARTLDALLKGSEDLQASYLRQYQIGRKSWLDVLNAQREKAEARNGLSDVTLGQQALKLRLLLLTGEIGPDNLGKLNE